MIRKAIESDFPSVADNECLTRILGLRLAYGPDASFVQYFSDGKGGLMSLMDGVAILDLAEPTEEWTVFLGMNPGVVAIHCSDHVGNALISTGNWKGRVGETMVFSGESLEFLDNAVCNNPRLPAVYDLLKEHFPGISSFNYW